MYILQQIVIKTFLKSGAIRVQKARLSMIAILPPKRAGSVDDLTANTCLYHVA